MEVEAPDDSASANVGSGSNVYSEVGMCISLIDIETSNTNVALACPHVSSAYLETGSPDNLDQTCLTTVLYVTLI